MEVSFHDNALGRSEPVSYEEKKCCFPSFHPSSTLTKLEKYLKRSMLSGPTARVTKIRLQPNHGQGLALSDLLLP